MYSKYDQELLCKVFLQCRKWGLVNRRRVSQPFGPKKNRALPILPMSYQLSQSYYRCSHRGARVFAPLSGSVANRCVVHRSFSTRFPHSLFTDSFRFLRTLRNRRRVDRRPLIEFYTETANRPDNGEETRETSKEPGKGKKQTVGREDGGEGRETANKESNEEEEKGEEEKNPGSPSARAPEESPDVLDMMPFSLDSLGGACVASLSLMSLGMLNVHISIPKHIVVVDSNLVDSDTVKR